MGIRTGRMSRSLETCRRTKGSSQNRMDRPRSRSASWHAGIGDSDEGANRRATHISRRDQHDWYQYRQAHIASGWPRFTRCDRRAAESAAQSDRALSRERPTIARSGSKPAWQHTDGCQRLMTVPGIGPIIASDMVAAISNGAPFAKGRDLAAWLGLVPKQFVDRRPHCTRAYLQAWQPPSSYPLYPG